MQIARLSKTGKIVIPVEMRKAYGLDEETEIILTDTGQGILIQPKRPFPPTRLDEVAGCLNYQGPPKSLEDMETAISRGIQEQWHDCD
ncbi:MAG: AbrB/MazE/SpoVT family DNA-binding domain-containing protein [Phormidium sp. GEM2.Bin31]|nr:MAG: AbrB/MazE/SpoVT family DNA-binding domain-containing protein [Phormidium sp. GEM2.Bin31]